MRGWRRSTSGLKRAFLGKSGLSRAMIWVVVGGCAVCRRLSRGNGWSGVDLGSQMGWRGGSGGEWRCGVSQVGAGVLIRMQLAH